MYFEKIIEEMSKLQAVEAITLGGSRSTGVNDDNSDYDIYIYTSDNISIEEKASILNKYCSQTELSNHYWELEDNCVMKDGIHIDIIYRTVDKFDELLHYIVEEGNPFNGYTTCFWHNLLTCKILYDRNGLLAAQKKRFDVPYPQKLKKNIIENNMKLLSGCLPSYDTQIKKAYNRGDLVSVNHRIAAFLESYFDVIFALNEKTHPGEKRLVSLALKECKILPKNFEENINKLFKSMFTDAVVEAVDMLVLELKAIVNENS